MWAATTRSGSSGSADSVGSRSTPSRSCLSEMSITSRRSIVTFGKNCPLSPPKSTAQLNGLWRPAIARTLRLESHPILDSRRTRSEGIVDTVSIPRLPRPANANVLLIPVIDVESCAFGFVITAVEEGESTPFAFAIPRLMSERRIDQLGDEWSDDAARRQRSLAPASRTVVGEVHDCRLSSRSERELVSRRAGAVDPERSSGSHGDMLSGRGGVNSPPTS